MQEHVHSASVTVESAIQREIRTGAQLPPLVVVLFTTLLAFAVLYMPQPILPLLAVQFGVAETDAALLTSVTLVPLGLAPIFYGFLTERISTKTLLRTAVGLLAVTEVLFGVATDFWLLVVLRFAQGLLLPAIFTSLITYASSTASADRVRHAVSYYIGTSILGGFGGRFLGGSVSAYLEWRWAFFLMAGLLVGAWVLLGFLQSAPQSRRNSDTRPLIRLGAISEILSGRIFRYACLGIFVVFFVYASVLNYIPFRLTALSADISELAISLVYAGYLSGALIALNGVRISGWVGGEVRGIFVGLSLLIVGLSGLLLPSLVASYVFAITMSCGFFLVHSLLSAFINHRATGSKGLVNGLYLAFYYSGGALGSWLPGFLYRASGWNTYIATLTALLALACWWMWQLRSASQR